MSKEKVEEKNEFVSSSGSRLYHPIEYKYSEDDKCFVPYYGKPIDRYAMIQAMAPSCDINYIVKRALAGDITALNVRTSSYADISDIPDNLNDLHEFENMSQKRFNNLDPQIKNLFDNDFIKFSESVEDGTINDIISKFMDSKNEKVEEKKESEN